MANGRLGKALIAPLETVAVYTNNSGAEASVSVVAQADDGANMHLRIDDTSDALTATTTVLSEAYSDTYVKYEVSGTGLAETTTYVGRLQFHDPSNVTSYKGVFEYYDADSATTYTDTSATSVVTNSGQGLLSWGVFSSDVSAPYVLSTMRDGGGTSYAALYVADSTAAYYYGWLAGKFSGGLNAPVAYVNMNYYQTGFASDPYEADYPWVIAMNTAGYMSGVFADGTTLYTGIASTVSTARDMSLTGPSAPTTTIQYPYFRASKRAYTIDGCNQVAYFTMCVPQDSTFDAPSATKASNLVDKNYNYSLLVVLGSARAGGNVLYHEYNPNDGRWYVGYRSGTTGYVASYTRDGFIAGGSLATTTVINFGDDSSAMDFYHGTLTLPLVTHTFGTANATYRTVRVGPSLWALVATTFGSTSAAETFYSTDLQTWVAASSYYSPYDYEAVEGSAIIRSDAGAVTSTKSAILTLGTDGVLENNVSFSQYERTGLVLSNGDRIVAYNDESSTSNISIQVMGYEGN